MLYGLEREFFIAHLEDGQGPRIIESDGPWDNLVERIVSARECGLHYAACDECGYLAEARGKPANNITEAYFLLKFAERQLVKNMKTGYVLVAVDYLKIPAKVLKKFQMSYGKNPASNESMYGPIKLDSYSHAGLHIHFSNETIVRCEDGKEQRVSGFMNMPRIIKNLDTFFADEIKASKRRKGEYEIKNHGFEYRSLGTSVGNDLEKLEKAFRIVHEREVSNA